MADKVLSTFTIGQGKAIPVNHTGPASYATGGETYGSINNQTGVVLVRLVRYVAAGPTNSGNYFVYAYPTGTGESKTYKLVWVTATTGIPTTTQVTAAVNLSAENVRLLVVGR